MSRMTQDLFSALSHFPRFWSQSLARRIVVFLDYDGTLTPIVSRPDLAVLAPETWDVLRALASRTKVAIVSGRDLDNVRRMVGLETLWCGYFEGNDKSRRVQEKCGFTYHHTNRDIYWKMMDEVRTEHVTRLTRAEWDAMRQAESRN